MVPTLVDIDNDGVLDLFVVKVWALVYPCFSQRSLEFYKNKGTNEDPDFLPPVSYPFGIPNSADINLLSFVDIDNDGDQDLFSSSFCQANNKFVFIRNEDSGSGPDFGGSPVEYNPFGLDPGDVIIPTLSFGDVNGDEKIDAIINGRTSQKFLYLENNGTKEDPQFNPWQENPFNLEIGETAYGPVFSLLEDWDCDGDLDIVNSIWQFDINSYLFVAYYFENKYEELETTSFAPAQLLPDSIHFITKGDMDGDGDMDVMSNNNYFRNVTENDCVVGAREVPFFNVLNVYPNPVTDNLILKFQTHPPFQDVNLSILDALGRPVWEDQTDLLGNETTRQLDVSTLPNGLYTLRLMTEGMVAGKQFVVVRE